MCISPPGGVVWQGQECHALTKCRQKRTHNHDPEGVPVAQWRAVQVQLFGRLAIPETHTGRGFVAGIFRRGTFRVSNSHEISHMIFRPLGEINLLRNHLEEFRKISCPTVA